MTEPAPAPAESRAPRVWRPILEALAVLVMVALLLDMVDEELRQRDVTRMSDLLEQAQRPVEGESPEARTARVQAAAGEAHAIAQGMPGHRVGIRLAFLAMMLVVAFVAGRLVGGGLGLGPPGIDVGQRWRLALGSAGVGALLVLLARLPFAGPDALVLVVVLGSPAGTAPGAWGALSGELRLLMAINALLAAPLACELFFRGFVQRRLAWRMSGPVAVVLAALLSCFVLQVPGGIPGALLASLWLGGVAWRTGSTRVAVLCHALINAVWLAVAVSGH